MRNDIHKLGMEAARAGLSLYDCPYFLAKAMPGHTGEAITKWLYQVECWEHGWRDATDARLAHHDRAAMLYALRHSH